MPVDRNTSFRPLLRSGPRPHARWRRPGSWRSPASAVGAVNKALTDFAYDEGMISVSDGQLRIVATAADLLPGEARGKFLRRVVAELREGQDFKDVDVEQAVRAALLDLSESPSH